MVRGLEVAFVLVVILAIGYLCVSPDLDEADELVQDGPNVTWISVHVIASNQLSPIRPIHPLIRVSIPHFSELGPIEITCSRRC
jgi:hypothetical protein